VHPWPVYLTVYNSILTYTSGDPIGLITLVPKDEQLDSMCVCVFAGVVYTCCQLIRANPGGKQVVLDAKLVPVLLRMLGLPSGGPSVAAACHGLYAVSYGDTDMQNEVAGNVSLAGLCDWGRGAGFAVRLPCLLCCLSCRGQQYVKLLLNAAVSQASIFAYDLHVMYAGCAPCDPLPCPWARSLCGPRCVAAMLPAAWQHVC
jgi:hypothetical protein